MAPAADMAEALALVMVVQADLAILVVAHLDHPAFAAADPVVVHTLVMPRLDTSYGAGLAVD